MPELPEVETVRRVLGPCIAGLTVADAEVRAPKVVAFPSAEEFAEAVRGRTVADMGRRGKFLIVSMDDGSRIVIHLRMTGCLVFSPCGRPEEPHTHLVLRFGDEGELRFSDVRRFGRVWLLAPGEGTAATGMDSLGPEPDDPGLTADYLKERLGRSRRAVKECIMDQSVIAGLGNIYADEILFETRILPVRPASTLTDEEWGRLAEAVPRMIRFFTDANATTPEDFLETGGKGYRNTPHLRAYGHAGEHCPRCGSVMERTVVGGRGSTFCPVCQR